MNRGLVIVTLCLFVTMSIIPVIYANGAVVYTPGVTPGMSAKWELNDYYDASYLAMNVLNVSNSLVTAKITVTEVNNTQISKIVGLSVSNLSVVMVPIVNTITAKVVAWNGNNGEIRVQSAGFVNGTGTVQVIAGGTNNTTVLTSGSSEVDVTTYAPGINTNNIGINGIIKYRSCPSALAVLQTNENRCLTVTLSNESGVFPLRLNSNTTINTRVTSSIPVLDFNVGPISLPPILISGNLSNKDQLSLNVPVSVSNNGVGIFFGHVRNLLAVSFPTPEGTISGQWDQQTGLMTSYVVNENAITSISLVSTNAFNGEKTTIQTEFVIAESGVWSVIGGMYAGYFWSCVITYVIGFAMMTWWDASINLKRKNLVRFAIIVIGGISIIGTLIIGGVI